MISLTSFNNIFITIEEEETLFKFYVGRQGAQARPGNSKNSRIDVNTKNITQTKKTRQHGNMVAKKKTEQYKFLIKGRDILII